MPLSFSRSHITVAGLMFTFLLLSACGNSGQEQAPAAPPPPEVSVVTLKAQDIAMTRELPGRVSALLVAEVRPQVSGIIKRRMFTEGGVVKAGQPLYQLDDSSYQADHASTRANLERARATLQSTQLTAKRSAELVKIDAISQQDNENAAAALAQARADVAAAEAALQRSGVVLGYATITSPINGRIGRSSVTQGALVTANQAEALATVQQLDPVYVDVSQSSSELLELRKELAAGRVSQSGDVPVKIVLEDGSLYKRDGKLAFADVTVDPSTGSFGLRVQVPNPDHILLPGMYVRAQISNSERKDAVLVPQRAVARDPKGNASVMLVDQDNKVQARSLTTNRTIGDAWLVDEGLAPGDRVVVEGLQKIQPGITVTTVEAAPANAAPAPGAAPAAASAESGADQADTNAGAGTSTNAASR